MTVTFETNPSGDEVAIIVNEDGTTISMLKSTYDELKANEAKTI
jgi:hypothetical protein